MSATMTSTSTQRRYKEFINTCSESNLQPVIVFEPLTPIQLSELQLIRDLSIELQNKKDEDMRKAAEAAAEAVKVQEEEKVQEKTIENVEEKTEKESQEQ